MSTLLDYHRLSVGVSTCPHRVMAAVMMTSHFGTGTVAVAVTLFDNNGLSGCRNRKQHGRARHKHRKHSHGDLPSSVTYKLASRKKFR